MVRPLFEKNVKKSANRYQNALCIIACWDLQRATIENAFLWYKKGLL